MVICRISLVCFVFFLVVEFSVIEHASCSQDKNTFSLDNGGYSGLLIAIKNDVTEDTSIIDNLKSMFTAASESLYNASKQHVYWENITILVPASWSPQPDYDVATTESCESANIVIHDGTEHEPFVVKLAPDCGKQGHEICMTSKFVKNETYREERFGSTDKVLVRNWAYYRWGLFRENYDGASWPIEQPAYKVEGQDDVEGTRCSLEIKGYAVMPDGITCGLNHADSGFAQECKFKPSKHQQTPTTSLLFGTQDVNHVDSIVDFCDRSSHNAMAPNLQNNFCVGASAWKVMMENTTDFRTGPYPGVTNTTPSFQVVQYSSEFNYVMVLDVSGSMNGIRFEQMIQSSSDFIQKIPENSRLGIVVFSTTARVNANMTLVTDKSSRDSLQSALPSGTETSTCIGCGILKGIEVLGHYSPGGIMMLLSDGEENVAPYIEDTLDDIDSSGIIMDTITISNSADEKMEDLSNRSSGKSTFCSGSGSGSCPIQAFQRSVMERTQKGSWGSIPTQIYLSDVEIPPYDSKELTIIIDSNLGNDTVFTVTWAWNSLVKTVIAGPDNTFIDHNDMSYTVDTGTQIITVKVPVAWPGRWNVTIINPGYMIEDASVSVTSKPSSLNYKPVALNVVLGSREVNFAQQPALSVYAQLYQNYQPVVGADVDAIMSSEYSTSTLNLFDNGAGADLLKDDGIYSAYFLNFDDNGRYNVKVDVIGYEGVSKTTRDSAHTYSGKVRRDAQLDVTSSSEPAFMRTASGGTFKVQGYTPNAPDILPPARIQDLHYTSYSYDNRAVELSWTAVGDDLDQGTAQNYELGYSTNASSIREDFSASSFVMEDDLLNGNLSVAAPSGRTELVNIFLPANGEDVLFSFAIRALDEAGNYGEVSNIVSVMIPFASNSLNTTASYTNTTDPTYITSPYGTTQNDDPTTNVTELYDTTPNTTGTPQNNSSPVFTTPYPPGTPPNRGSSESPTAPRNSSPVFTTPFPPGTPPNRGSSESPTESRNSSPVFTTPFPPGTPPNRSLSESPTEPHNSSPPSRPTNTSSEESPGESSNQILIIGVSCVFVLIGASTIGAFFYVKKKKKPPSVSPTPGPSIDGTSIEGDGQTHGTAHENPTFAVVDESTNVAN